MKLKNVKDELNFVCTATPGELHSYIKTTPFSHVAVEKALIKRSLDEDKNLTDIIAKYIRKYSLRPSARIMIFRRNALGLIRLLLSEKSEHKTILTEFLTHGDYHSIWLYLSQLKEDTSEIFPEEALIAAHNVPELHKLAVSKQLTPFAQYNIIFKNFNLGLTNSIILSGGLNEREKMTVIKQGDWETVNYLIECEKDPAQKHLLEELKFIRFSCGSKIEKFIKTTRFSQKAERFFLNYREFSLIIRYIKHYNIESGHEILIKRAGPNEILGYLSKNWLCESGEKLLLDRGKHREIKAYIKAQYFSEDNETRFVKRGKHNEIMLYIANHSLCDTAQKELIYRRNASEIEYYITHYPLSDIATEVLLDKADPQIIRLWQACRTKEPLPLL